MHETFQPKGSMCVACVRMKLDCSKLPFRAMPVLKIMEDHVGTTFAWRTIVVKCTEFTPLVIERDQHRRRDHATRTETRR